jgi:hypothetical protein
VRGVNEEVAGKGGSRDQGNRRLEELASWGRGLGRNRTC